MLLLFERTRDAEDKCFSYVQMVAISYTTLIFFRISLLAGVCGAESARKEVAGWGRRRSNHGCLP